MSSVRGWFLSSHLFHGFSVLLPSTACYSIYLLCILQMHQLNDLVKEQKANKTLNTLKFFQNKTGNDRTRTSSWGQEQGRNSGFAAREEEQGATDLGSFILHLISSKYKLPPNMQLHLPCHWTPPEQPFGATGSCPSSPDMMNALYQVLPMWAVGSWALLVAPLQLTSPLWAGNLCGTAQTPSGQYNSFPSKQEALRIYSGYCSIEFFLKMIFNLQLLTSQATVHSISYTGYCLLWGIRGTIPWFCTLKLAVKCRENS